MPGVKRKFSSAFKADEAPRKLVKRNTSSTVSRALSELRKTTTIPKLPPVPCFPALIPTSEAIKEVEKETSEVTTLRRVSTLPLADAEPGEDEDAALGEKKSTVRKPTLTKKMSSVDSREVMTTITKLKSGSSIGKIVGISSTTSKASLTDGISKLSSKEASVALLSKKSTKGAPEAGCSTSDGEAPKRMPSKGKSLSKRASSAAPAAWLPPGGLMEIVFSFDTTGSMSSCLKEVRGRLKDMIQRLQADIPGIRIAVIAHGDYCDASNYVIKWVDFGSTLPELCDFVTGISSTGGGDGDECYELVLKTACDALSWTPGSQRSLAIIGDSNPHEVTYHFSSFGDFEPIDWRKELDRVVDKDIRIYGIHAKGYANSKPFYETMAKKSGGRYMKLEQFSDVFDMMMAICYREKGVEAFEAYEDEVRGRSDTEIDWGLELIFDALKKDIASSKTAAPKAKLTPFAPAKKVVAPKAKPATKPVKAAKKTKAPVKTKTKKVVKTKAKAKTVKAKKTKKGKAKRSKQVKKVRKHRYREEVADTTFLRGALARLKWSAYELGLSRTASGAGTKKEEWSLRRKGYEGYRRKELYNRDTDVFALYEIAVSPPNSTKKYVVYYRVTAGFLRDRIWDTFLLRNKTIAKQLNDVISKGGDIFIRRGVFKQRRADQMRKVSSHLTTYDYAWKKRGKAKPNHRSLIHSDNKFVVSNDKY